MPELANQQLLGLVALWEQRRGGRCTPTREDLPVQDLRPWLGSLAIIEFRPDGPHFRLCGTALHRRFGGEMTGKPVAALNSDVARPLRLHLESVLADQRPRRASHSNTQTPPTNFQEVYLPIVGRGGSGDMVLFASFPEGKS